MSETKRPRGRPSTGVTPKRYFRMEDEAYETVKLAATLEGQTLSDYIRSVISRDAKRVTDKANGR